MADIKKRRGRAAIDVNWRQTQVGIGLFFDLVAPWLLDLGSWIFGALIAFNLVILGVVLTIGPVDTAEKLATAAFALALPPNVSGFVLVRLVTDMRKIRAPDQAAQAFKQAGFELENPQLNRQEDERRMSGVALSYTYGLMSVSLLLTLAGLTAALWHSAWWIGVGFVVMLVLSIGLLLLAASQMGGRSQRWRSPAGEHDSKKPQEG